MKIDFTKKDEEFFKKNGFLIKKTNSVESIDYLRKKIIDFIFLKKPKIKKKVKGKNIPIILSNFHKLIKKNELNDLRIFIINKLNKDKNFDKKYYLASKDILEFLVGNELAMQTKINLSVQIPNDQTSTLPMHSDIYAGESPFEVVCWIPLMDVKPNSQSMFITSPKENKIINNMVSKSKNITILKIYNKHKKKFRFLKINYGEILVFSPILLHGNIVNKTNLTRFSLNCRFKSILTPFDVFNKTHRNIPHFFKPLTIKPLTQVGFNFINTINEKN